MSRGRRRAPWAARVALLGVAACAGSAEPPAELREVEFSVFRMEPANRGPESYSAWFADRGGDVLYFGLSSFWDALDQGGPTAELRESGDHLIGRFDLKRERFLAPLRVRAMAPDVRGSVWDVLAHSSGRVCYTTFFEEAGCVDPVTGERALFPERLSAGLNELAEGPDGAIYATRYAGDATARVPGGATVLVLGAGGELRRVLPLPAGSPEGGHPAAKSVAVDPLSGEVWVNADVIREDGGIAFEHYRLSAGGELLERFREPELLFMRFDASGRGWFVYDEAGELVLRVRRAGAPLAEQTLGPRAPADFAQDIHFAADGEAALAFWSGRVVLAHLERRGLRARSVDFPRPSGCRPSRRALLYSAVLADPARVVATLSCGATVLRARIGSP